MYLGVHIVFGEVPRLGGPAVSMCKGPQALQSLGHDTGESLFPRQLRYEEHVLGSIDLIRTVCTSCRTVTRDREGARQR